MNTKEYNALLTIKQHIKSVFEYSNKFLSYEEFIADQICVDACILRISQIGETINKKISKETQNKYTQIDWKKIIGMRNVVLHDYIGINLKIVWNTIKLNLPELDKKIDSIIDCCEVYDD